MKHERALPVWPALLLAPALVLAEQALAYALVAPLCARQQGAWLHAVPMAFMALVLLLTVLAACEVHRLGGLRPGTGPSDAVARRPLFVARVATGIGALSLLVLVALWMPQWWLSPCIT